MNEILLYGIIGDRADNLDALTVCSAIRSMQGDIAVRINSPGGSVFEGLPIYEALAAYGGGKVMVYIDGLAASMASVIAMAGDDIIMAESALMMMHKPWDASIGNADELRQDAARLDTIERQLVGIYAKRSGLSPARIRAMLAAETWFDAEQAQSAGFATSSAPALKLAAMADLSPYGFRHLPDQLKGHDMPTPSLTNKPTPASIADIRDVVAKAHLPEVFALDLAEQNLPIDKVREAVIDRLATENEATMPRNQWDEGGRTFDNPSFQANAIEDALYCRISGKQPEGAARELISLSMVDMAREMLGRAGVRNARRMKPVDALSAAAWNSARDRGSFLRAPRGDLGGLHTTSDFPELLLGAGQRYLLDMFEAAGSAIKVVARERAANDFRAMSVLQLSGAGTLDELNEAGEIKRGTFNEAKESYSVKTWAKIFGISRNALINDDMGAFSDPLRAMARGAAETEASQLAALIAENGPTLDDGKALFHLDHKNKATTAAAISVATLSDGRRALREQKDRDGVTPLSAAAKYLLVGTAKETEAELFTSTIQPNQTADINPFAGKMTPLVDPRIAGNAWMLFADPALMPVIEYAYLNAARGPQTEIKDGWDVLGTEFRVVLDFGCGVVDYRGAYLNAGA